MVGRKGSLLLPELFAAYQAIEQGTQVDLPALSVQYADYAYWQNSRICRSFGLLEGQLAGYDDGVLIPTDFPREGAAGSQ